MRDERRRFLGWAFLVLAGPMLVLAAGVLNGCVGPQRQTLGAGAVAEGESMTLWQACQEELRRRGFRLDRVDRRAGVIEAYPRVSSQWFEFWGGDIATPAAAAEASLQTIRRRVRLEVGPAAGGGCKLRCEVAVERLSLGPRMVSGDVQALDIYRYAAALYSDPLAPAGRKMSAATWVPLGNDSALAGQIVRDIEAAACGKSDPCDG